MNVNEDIKLSVCGVCDIGLKKPNNEDMILLGDEIFRDGQRQKEFDVESGLVIAVADGIGGLDKGEVASELALTRLRDILSKLPGDLSEGELQEVFDVYTQETHALMRGGMGSTLVGIFFYRDMVFRFHAGDSRIYLLRNGGLQRLTTDHSLRESGGNPDAPSNVITNALGGGGSAFMEFAELEPFLEGDVYLLSSDGLHDLVSAGGISDALSLEPSEKPHEKLLAMAKEKGGLDNISIVTVRAYSHASKLKGD